MVASWPQVASQQSAHVVCTCALVVTRPGTRWSCAVMQRRVDKPAPLDHLLSFVERGRKVQVGEPKVMHFQRRVMANATMHLMFPPSPKRRTSLRRGSRNPICFHCRNRGNAKQKRSCSIQLQSDFFWDVFGRFVHDLCWFCKAIQGGTRVRVQDDGHRPFSC